MVSMSLVHNLSLLVTLSLLNGLLMRRFQGRGAGYVLLRGLMFGAITLAGMATPVVHQPGLIFDGRSIVLGIAGLFGGPIVAGVAAAMAIAFRIHLGGTGALLGVLSILESASLGVAGHYLRRDRKGGNRVLDYLGLGFLIHLVVVGTMEVLPGPLAGEVIRRMGPFFLLVYPAAFMLVGIAFDELEKHFLTEAALRDSEERFRTIFEEGMDGIVMFSFKGEVLEVNESFARMHGYRPAEMKGMWLSDLDAPESAKGIGSRMRRLMMGETLRVELDQIHRDGHTYHVEAAASRIVLGGKPLILSFHRDISERKLAETSMRALEVQLHHSQKMESLGILAGGIAHDMNNVLGAILGLASAHLEGGSLGSVRGAFETIVKAAERGARMVQGLLTFARQSPADERQLNMNELVRENMRLLERTTLAKVRIELDLAQDLHPLRGDAGSLVQVLMNLCINAVDAMAGHGILTVRTRNADAGRIEVCVEDTGTGMSREVQARAMDPFFTTKEPGKGTGLGLAMAYTTVKAHGGALELHSEPGRGTRVRMLLPAREAEAPEPEAPGAASAAGPVQALAILLVDDDELIQASTRMLVEALGHAFTGVPSGEDALAWLDGGGHPDRVILDLNMPGMGGKGVLPLVRARCPGVPILLATGRVDQEALDLVAGSPGVALLAKPFTLGELRENLVPSKLVT